MKLTPEETDLFYKLFCSLLGYTNQKLQVVPGRETPSPPRELWQWPMEDRSAIRDALWEHAEELISSFVRENPFGFSAQELDIVESWKHFLYGDFMLVSQLKKHAVFFDQKQGVPYGVLALTEDFADMLGPRLPLYIKTVLLPFNGQITYDGFLAAFPILFGRGASRSILSGYQQAKAKYGIVTSLPFSPESRKESDEELLKFYLKNQDHRERYAEDIWSLLRKKPALRVVYHQEMGKVHARTYRKRLRDSGIESGWFGVLDANIVAVGRTEAELKKIMKEIVPREKQDWVHVFRLGK